MKHLIHTVFTVLSTFFILVSCSEDEGSQSQPPVIKYIVSQLDVDLNAVTYPQIVATVESEAGLRSVTTYVVLKDGTESMLDQPETDFYNIHTHSVSKQPLYTEEMAGFRIVALDRQGQSVTADLPFVVTTLIPLPEIVFTDSEGNELSSYLHFAHAQMPGIRIKASSEEELKSLSIYQILNTGSQVLITDPYTFTEGEKQIDIDIREFADGFIFDGNIIALRAQIKAGLRERTRETSLPVNVKKSVSVSITEDVQYFNGLENNRTYPFSGSIQLAEPLDGNITFSLLNKQRELIEKKTIASVTDQSDGLKSFTADFTTSTNLGYIVVEATGASGYIDKCEVDVHVGYKYWHLLASTSGFNGSLNTSNPVGCFINSTDGKMYRYPEAAADAQHVDVGIAWWTGAGGTITRLPSTKFRDFNKQYNASGESKYGDSWCVNKYDIYSAVSITADNFLEATAADLATIECTDGSGGKGTGHRIVTGFNVPFPEQVSVAAYQKVVDGEKKWVVILFDRAETPASGDNEWLSTFWIHVKTEI